MSDETENGGYPTSFRDSFLRFKDEWIEHKAEAKAMMAQIAATKETLVEMKAKMEHLGELPKIAAGVEHIGEGFKGNNKWLLLLLAAVVLAILVLVFILVIKDSNKNLTINRDGLSITETQKHPPN